MRALFDKVSYRSSVIVTKSYSTSFSLGIMLLDKTLRQHVYAIYGFVRFADEIVDTFHEHDKAHLLNDFKNQTHDAISRGISLNPILNSFQKTVNEFQIDRDLIDTFLKSMEMDLNPIEAYSREEYEEYILGSAEVVGLMCLKVFCYGDQEQYEVLSHEAMKLGSAFQKINFLRDLNADYYDLGRVYFPNIDMKTFDDSVKAEIEADIEKDFKLGYEGILKLPKKARFGVYIAYVYYYSLFQKIRALPADAILEQRVRIANRNKYGLLLSSYFKHSFNLL
ncbi:phytoene/squalene synthase family protein [Owenweeksia hongkongensis]|uniref:phytoene/squalene synthase family protein n=1 Tax=Owenweeksia hongkongensis TaxID=253245 RepID=UPI003A916766